MDIKLRELLDYARQNLYDENILENHKGMINMFESGIEDLVKQNEKPDGQVQLEQLVIPQTPTGEERVLIIKNILREALEDMVLMNKSDVGLKAYHVIAILHSSIERCLSV